MSIYSVIFFLTCASVCLFQLSVCIKNYPLVGVKVEKSEYKIPKCVKVTSNELQFYLPGEYSKSEAAYFCPKSAEDYLLYPTMKSECKLEPTPKLRRATDEESHKTDCPNRINKYTLYTYGYQVAYKKNFEEKQGYSWDAWMEMYTFCFIHAEERIWYMSYQISSPNLLASDLLSEQHRYLGEKYNLDHFNNPQLRKYIKLIKDRYNEYDKHMHSGPQFQGMIASPFDMAFAVWKTPFIHLINYTIFSSWIAAHQWVKIHQFVRKLAINGWGELHIKVGMAHHNIGNLYKVWWKLIITEDQTHAIAIILHDITVSEQPDPNDGFTCETTCEEFGFEEMRTEFTENLLFCCPPNVITDAMGMKSYQTLNLKLAGYTILQPVPVDCDSNSKS